LVVLMQAALGGLVSAGYAGLACPGLACDAHGVPWSALDPWREPVLGAAGNVAGARLQLVHRAGALVVVALLVPLALLAWRARRRGAALALLGLLALQCALGVALVLGRLPLPAALAHNLAAVLLLLAVTELAASGPARLR
ncbi:MAG TPA: COX15/CtaA family protein, partial [Burkholderiaceae bacterium]